MKLQNRLVILRCVRYEGPISRVDLQKKTRLSWGTISASTRELLDSGILTEIGAVTTDMGRRPVELDLNQADNFVLGLQLGSALVRSALMNMKGCVVAELDVPVNAAGTTAEILRCLIDTGNRLLRQHGVWRSSLMGIGVAVPGAVDFSTGISLYAPQHPNWKNVALKDRFERTFGVPCYVDHSFNCFALSEQLFGLCTATFRGRFENLPQFHSAGFRPRAITSDSITVSVPSSTAPREPQERNWVEFALSILSLVA
ncbi:MAG: ROK family transcriptional regulator [Spirochaetia bacterium]